MTRPLRPRIGWGTGAIAVGIGSLGFIVSAIGYTNIVFSIELWWAPFGVALVLASLGRTFPARVLVLLGLGAIAVTSPVAYLILHESAELGSGRDRAHHHRADRQWDRRHGRVLVRGGEPDEPLIDKRSEVLVSADAGRDDAAETAERVRLAQFTARAVPFLESAPTGCGDRGRPRTGRAARPAPARRPGHPVERDLAGFGGSGSRLVVIDPEHRAGRCGHAAHRSPCPVAGDPRHPGNRRGSLLVELRSAPDGSTAVGVSLEMELPEGRRIMHLAPYYLTLGTAVTMTKVGARSRAQLVAIALGDGLVLR